MRASLMFLILKELNTSPLLIDNTGNNEDKNSGNKDSLSLLFKLDSLLIKLADTSSGCLLIFIIFELGNIVERLK